MKNKKKCLVVEAREKCQCEWCKQVREWNRISLEAVCKAEVMRIFREAIKDEQKLSERKEI